MERAAGIIRCAGSPHLAGHGAHRGCWPGLTVCPLCRDAGDELALTVLRCTSVSGSRSTHGLAAGSEGLAKA